MKRSFFVSFLVSSLALGGATTFTACGGDNSSGGGGDSGTGGDSMAGDSGVVDTGHPTDSGHPMDSGVTDTGTPSDTGTPTDSGVDSGMPPTACLDAGSVPGTQLAAGNFILYGVTSDGYAIYTDNAMPPNVWAASITGTPAPAMVTTVGNNPLIIVTGTTALIWANVLQSPPQITSLSVWNHANGFHQAAGVTIAGDAAVSPDGSVILFVGNVDPVTGKTGDLIANTTDFANNGTTVVSGVNVDQTTQCTPRFAFAGPAASVVPLATYCLTGDAGTGGPDGAPPGGTLSKFTQAGPMWSKTDLLANTFPGTPFNADSAGTAVFLATTSLNGMLVPINGAPPTMIDTGVFDGVLSPDGSKVVYITVAQDSMMNIIGALKQSPTMAPAPVLLYQGTLNANVDGFYSNALGIGFSPNFANFYYFGLTDMTGALTDLHMLDTTTANQTPTDLATTANAALFASGWTADSAFATWYAPVEFSGPTAGFGKFNITQVSNKMLIPLPMSASATWNNFALGTTGSKDAYNDNGVPNQTQQLKGTADIEVIDLSMANPTPTKVVAGADVNFNPSPDGTQLVYTYSCSMATQGLYVVAAP